MADSTLFRGGWVLAPDGTTTEPLDVLVTDGLITEIGVSLNADSAHVVDCTGSTVMPGLIDAHVHLAMAGPPEPDGGIDQTRARVADNARKLLAAGVTTARDAAGPAEVLLPQRTQCAADMAAGPQLLLCCEAIAWVGGHGTEFSGSAKIATEVGSPAAARDAVRHHIQVGADWIKVMLNGANDELEIDVDHLRAIVDEARAQGIRVAAHASNPRAVALAVSCGVDSIEHGNDIDDELAMAMAEAGIAMVTTTHVYRAGAGCAHTRGGMDPLAAFEPSVQEQVRSIMAVRVAAHEKAIPAMLRAGARIVLGTDAVIGPIDLAADELLSLTMLGMTPTQALQAATTTAAEVLELHDRGRIDTGLRADLIVVRGRADEDITAVTEPVLVMRGGAVVS